MYVRHLRAFLSHHMQLCERGFVAIDCRSEEEGRASEAYRMIETEWAGRVTPVIVASPSFRNSTTLHELSRAIHGLPGIDYVLHLDQDEFVPDYIDVGDIVRQMRESAHDCAVGWMVCRFGPGLAKYSAELPTYESFRVAAPVRAEVRKAQGCTTTKVWLARYPNVRIHDAPKWMRRHPSNIAIDHFLWTQQRRADSVGKAAQYAGAEAARVRAAEVDADARNDRFVSMARRTFIPLSGKRPGWFNYADVYRAIALWMPKGGTFVEVGVFRGRSLGYLAEYAALRGLDFKMYGVDYFSPFPTKTIHKHVFGTAEEMCAEVQAALAYAAPTNTPALITGLSHEMAGKFADASVDALWIDADHTYEAVARDIQAWLPKLRPGAVMAGHDLGNSYPGVGRALKACGVRFRPVSKNSWLAVGATFAHLNV